MKVATEAPRSCSAAPALPGVSDRAFFRDARAAQIEDGENYILTMYRARFASSCMLSAWTLELSRRLKSSGVDHRSSPDQGIQRERLSK